MATAELGIMNQTQKSYARGRFLRDRGGLVSARASKGASSVMEGPSGAGVLGQYLIKVQCSYAVNISSKIPSS